MLPTNPAQNMPEENALFFVSRKTHKQKNIFWIFFEAQYLGGKIEISGEHIQYEWAHITPDNIDEYFTKGVLEGMRSYLHKKYA